ncbi:hypothetical protein LINPERHAP1_LOCUS23112 [Linum perenne]
MELTESDDFGTFHPVLLARKTTQINLEGNHSCVGFSNYRTGFQLIFSSPRGVFLSQRHIVYIDPNTTLQVISHFRNIVRIRHLSRNVGPCCMLMHIRGDVCTNYLFPLPWLGRRGHETNNVQLP